MTEQMKHTPGPWEAKDVESAGIEIFAKVDIGKEDMSGGVLQPIYRVSLEPSLQVGKDGIVRAMISYESWRQFPSINFQEMQRANAQLISAAPELLEACKIGLEEMKTWLKSEECDCPPEGHICGLPRLTRHIEQIRQAIAKAEGR